MKVGSVWNITRETVTEFLDDPALALSAATAYYAIFSIAPLLVLTVGVTGLVFGEDRVRQEVAAQLQSFVGGKSAQLIESMMSAQYKGGSLMATIVGGIALFIGATGVFGQLQTALNTIWGVTSKPGHGLWLFIRDRVLSLAMVLAIGFLLLVSMALSTFLNAFAHYIGAIMSLPPWIVPAFDAFVSFIVITLLFALIFKVLPDVKIEWRDVWMGAVGTALLFTAGKALLSLYLSHEVDASAYGAGSAFVVILMYIYYSSLILFFGAEFTQVYAKSRGARLQPSKYAVLVDESKAPAQAPNAPSPHRA